jgi:DNA-directed RNA polymerase specialized sigma24 family protein
VYADGLVAPGYVQKALENLPENYLTALLLFYGLVMSHKEAARVTGFTPGTIAAYVTHGRAALKLALEGRSRVKRKDTRGSGS